MGTLTDSLFSALMSWVRALVSAIWALFSAERTTALQFLAQNWLGIALLIILIGLVADWLVWLIRWQPYHIWARRVRRLLGAGEPEEQPEEGDYAPEDYAAYEAYEAPQQEQESWMPLERPVIGEEEAQQVMEAAGQVPDETLGRYPGMRYDGRSQFDAPEQESLGDTRTFAAVHEEGPGAAEVSRRRAEIDAWQRQMQEEARQKAQAERAAREAQLQRAREEREAREAEMARIAEQRAEEERARIAQQEAEAEQARLAQEEYERQMAQYEQEKAQYERDLAEYERQKAEYEAAMAAQQASATEFAQENPQPSAGARRRRRAVSYSDYVEGETVEELPAPPDWSAAHTAPAPQDAPKMEKKSRLRSGMSRMAQMIEPEAEEVTGIAALPPRIDRSAAYRPAKKPERSGEG